MSDRLLHIYLNDHLAGATAGQELAKRSSSNNAGTPLGDFLQRFLVEITEDRSVVEGVLHNVGGKVVRLKMTAGWIAEKVGRLKMNGQIRGYSDLSRVVELEGLCAGVEGKKAMWIALDDLSDDRLRGFDFKALGEKASRQKSELERFRADAARKAFA